MKPGTPSNNLPQRRAPEGRGKERSAQSTARLAPRSPARIAAPDPSAWLSIPDLATLPNVPVVPGPLNGGATGLAGAPPEAEATEWVSPARRDAPDAEVWLPIPDLRRLPSRHTARTGTHHPHGKPRPSGRPDRLPGRSPAALRAAPLRPVIPAPPVTTPVALQPTITAPVALQPTIPTAPPAPAKEVEFGVVPEIQPVTTRKRQKSRTLIITLVGVLLAGIAGIAWAVFPRESNSEELPVVLAERSTTTTTTSTSVASVSTKIGAVLLVDGRRLSVRTGETTVGAMLAEAGITVDADDIVDPLVASQPVQGMTVSVTRVLVRQESGSVPIEPPVERRDDPNLTAGVEKVLQAGSPGSATVQYSITLHDGVEVARATLGTPTVVTPPVARIVAVGTKAAPKQKPSPPASSTSVSKAAAPAPAPVTVSLPADTVAVAPQTPPSGTSESGKITFYELPGAPGPGYCAHKTLPFGTVVSVVNAANGKSVSCIVKDRGPYGAGRILDLSPKDFEQIAPLSQGVVTGSISWQVQ